MSNNVHSVVRRSVPCYFCNEFLEKKFNGAYNALRGGLGGMSQQMRGLRSSQEP